MPAASTSAASHGSMPQRRAPARLRPISAAANGSSASVAPKLMTTNCGSGVRIAGVRRSATV